MLLEKHHPLLQKFISVSGTEARFSKSYTGTAYCFLTIIMASLISFTQSECVNRLQLNFHTPLPCLKVSSIMSMSTLKGSLLYPGFI